MTHSEIIDKLGGTVAVSKALNVKHQCVTNWRRLGIAHAFRPGVMEMARRAGWADQIKPKEYYGFWPE